MSDASPHLDAAAIAACSRALAGSAVDVPAHDALSCAALRGRGDRAAIRCRWHDAGCHAAARPSSPAAARIFDVLEQARLDALGVRWLPGVALNIVADAGDERTLMHWMAFEALSGRRAPAPVQQRVARHRAAMPRALEPGLVALASLITGQPEFAAAAAQWAEAAGAHDWATEAIGRHATNALGAHDGRLPLSAREVTAGERAQPDNRHVGRRLPRGTAAPATSERAVAGYRAYTTADDRVVDAAALVQATDLARLRARLDAELGETRLAVTRLANRLRRMLMARQARWWRFDLDEGVLDATRLAGLVAAPGDARPFKAESDSPFPTAAVSLLIDCSGSMRGRPILVAALTVEILAQALERCGIAAEVLGYTTRAWDGGRPYAEWRAGGAAPNPGRLTALEHIVIKHADVPWRRARHGLGIVLHEEILKENVDGEAVQWAHARLRRRPERRKLLLVVSDGAPHDEATEQANGDTLLARHLRAVVEDIEAHSPVEIAAIGVGHDVRRFYSRAVSIASADDLGDALSRSLAAFFAPATRAQVTM